MVSGHTFFIYDMATKLHFNTEDYNVFEYKGNVRGTSYKHFLAKRDHTSYNNLALKFDTDLESIQFLAANYVYKNSSPVHNTAVSNNNYIIWKKRKQSITNTFLTDVDSLILYMEKKDYQYKDLITCNGGMSELFKLYLGGQVTIESLHMINEMEPFLPEWKSKMLPMWSADLLIIKKLKKFVIFDEAKIKEIYLSLLF